jgi:hypothetical protein
MTKESFDNYKFSINTKVNFFEDVWDDVVEVDFEYRKIGVKRGQYVDFTEVKGIQG